LAFLDLNARRWQAVGPPGRYEVADLAPGGEFIFVARAADDCDPPPAPCDSRRSELEIWTAAGARVRRLPGLSGVGRGVVARWDPSRPARLAWVGAARDGDAPGRAVYVTEPAFKGPRRLFETAGILERISWSGNGSLIVTEAPAGDGRQRTWAFAGGDGAPRMVWDRTPATGR
jgi:dipeptidyl aminopeptidase/acylaminoacyl peptidase